MTNRQEVFTSDIVIKLPDSAQLKAQLAEIERQVKASAAAMQKTLSLTVSGGIGGSQGGLRDTSVKQARQIQAAVARELRAVREEFNKTATVSDKFDPLAGMEKALNRAAGEIGTTSDKIVARLAKLNSYAKGEWVDFADGGIKEAQRLADVLVNHSIIPDMVNDIERSISKIPDKARPDIQALIQEFEKLKAFVGTDVFKGLKEEQQLGIERTLVRLGKEAKKFEGAFAEPFEDANVRLDRELGKLDKQLLNSEIGLRKWRSSTDTALENAFGAGLNEQEKLVERWGQSISSIFAKLPDKTAPSAKAMRDQFNKLQAAMKATEEEIRSLSSGKSIGDVIDDGQLAQASLRMQAYRNEMLAFGKDLRIVYGRQVSEIDNAKRAQREMADAEKSATAERLASAREAKAAYEQAYRVQLKSEEKIRLESLKASDQYRNAEALVNELKSSLFKMGDKGSAQFIALRNEANKLNVELKKSLDSTDISKTVSGIQKIQAEANRISSDRMSKLTQNLRDVEQVSGVTSKKFSDRMSDMRNGISLLSVDGAKLVGLRTAFFGIADSTNPLARALDKLSGGMDSLAKTENKLASVAANYADQMTSLSGAMNANVKRLKDVAKEEGLAASELNKLDRSTQNVEKAYRDMLTQMETGKGAVKQVANIRRQAKSLQETIDILRKTPGIGPEVLGELNKLEKDMKAGANASRIMAVATDKLGKKMDEVKKNSSEMGNTSNQTTNIFKKFSLNLSHFFSIVINGKGDVDKLNRSIEQSAKSSQEASKSFLAAFSGGAIGGGLVAGIGAIKQALSGVTFNLGGEVKKETLRIQAAFALLPEEASNVSKIISGVYMDNFGGSVEEVGAAVQEAIGRLRRVGVTSGEEIQSATEDAFRLKDAYGTDVTDSLNATQVLMKNFGLTSAQSMDFLAGLAQKGVIGPDVIDSITEYSVQIANAGGSAETLFNLLETGFQGVGTLGTDRALDMFKEFRVRIQDGSDTTRKALEQLGVNSTQLLSDMSNGVVSTEQAFNFLIGELKNVDSEAMQMQIGVGLMGTQFEDLGQKAAFALSTTGTSMEDLAGATEKVDVMYTTFAAQFQQITRNMSEAISPLREALLAIGNYIIPLVTGAFEKMKPSIDWLSANIMNIVELMKSGEWGRAGEYIVNVFGSIVETVSEGIIRLTTVAFDWGSNLVVEVANGIIETASRVIVDAANYVSEIISSMWESHSPPKEGPLKEIDKWGKGLVSTYGESFSSADFDFVEKALSPIEDYFKNKFGEAGFDKFNSIREKFVGLTESINKTGKVDPKLFDEINAAMPGVADKYKKFIELQVKAKEASVNLERAQKQVADAEKAGFVPKALGDKLKAAEQESKVAEENVSWQEKYIAYQDKTKKGFAGMASAAGSIGRSAAAGTKAGLDALARYREYVTSGYAEEKRILEEQFSTGEITREEYVRKAVDLEEKYLDSSRRSGMIKGLEEHSLALKNLKKEYEGLKGGESGGLSGLAGGGTLFDPTAISDAADGVIPTIQWASREIGITLAEGISESFGSHMKTVMSDAGSKIGEAVGGAFTRVRQYLTEHLNSSNFGVFSVIFGAAVSLAANPIINKLSAVFKSIMGFLSGTGGFAGILKKIAKYGLKFGIVGGIILSFILNWDTVVKTSVEIWEGVSQGFGNFVGTINDAIKRLVSSDKFNESLVRIKDSFGRVLTVAIQVAGLLKKLPKILLAVIIIPIGTFLNDALNKFIDLQGGIENFVDNISSAFDSLSRVLDTVTSGISDALAAILLGDSEGAKNAILDMVLGLQGIDFSGFSNIGNAIGRTIAESFSSAFNSAISNTGMEDALSAFMGEGRLGGEVANLFKTISENIKPLSIILGAIILKVTPLLPMLGKFAVIFGKVSFVVTLVITAFKHFNELWPYIEGTLAGIVRGFTGVIEIVTGFVKLFDKSTFSEGFAQMQKGAVDLYTGILQAVIDAGAGILTFILALVEDISGGIADLLEVMGVDEKIIAPFRNVQEYMGLLIDGIAEKVEDAKAILFGITDQLKQIFDRGGNWFTILMGFRDALINAISDVFSNAVDSVKVAIVKFWQDGVVSTWERFGKAISDGIDSSVKSLEYHGEALLSGIRNLGRFIRGKFLNVIDSIKEGIKNAIDSAVTLFMVTIPSTGEKIKTSISDAITNAMNYVRDNWKDWANALAYGVGAAIGGILTFLTETLPNKENEIASKFINFISTAIDSVITFVTVTIPQWATSLGSKFTSWLDRAVALLDEARDTLVDSIKTTLVYIINGVMTFVAVTIPEWVSSLGDKFNGWLDQAVAYSEERKQARNEAIKATAASIITGVMTFFDQTLPQWVADMQARFASWLDGAVQYVVDNWETWRDQLFNTIKLLFITTPPMLVLLLPALAAEVGKFLGNMIIDGAAYFGGEINDHAAALAGAFSNMVDAYMILVQEKIPELAQRLGNFFGEIITSAASGIAATGPEWLQSMLGVGDDAVKKIGEGAANAAVDFDSATASMGNSIAAPVQQGATDAEAALQALADNAVNNSIVPDMVSAIGLEFMNMSTSVMGTLTSFSSSALMVFAGIRTGWETTIAAMTRAFDAFYKSASKILADIKKAFDQLRKSIDEATSATNMLKEALDVLAEVDLSGLSAAMEDFKSVVSDAANETEKLRDFLDESLETARKLKDALASEGVGITASGEPGHAAGAWKIPFDNYRARLHKGELVMPADMAETFRNLVSSLSGGIGDFAYRPATLGTPKQTAGGNQTVLIEANFPNVTSSKEATSIADALNELIDRSRASAMIGG